jgi:hypothetical protein
MLTKITDADWVTVLKVFEVSGSRRGDKGVLADRLFKGRSFPVPRMNVPVRSKKFPVCV